MSTEFRAALRSLVNSWPTTLAAIASLVVGVAINTAVFSVVQAVMFAPLPYPVPAQLIGIQDYRRTGEGHFLTAAEAMSLRTRLADIADVGFYRAGMGGRFARRLKTDANTAEGYAVDAGAFRLLGVRPHKGRFMLPADEVEIGRAHV